MSNPPPQTQPFPRSSRPPENVSIGGLVHGEVSMLGRKRVMEDATVMGNIDLGEKGYSYFGVFNAPNGPEAAETFRHKMQKCLEKQIETWNRMITSKMDENEQIMMSWEKVMGETFKAMDEEMTAAEVAEIVVVVSAEEVVVANCHGNSKVVLCRCGVAMPLIKCKDHEAGEAAREMFLNWDGLRSDGGVVHALRSSVPEGQCTFEGPEITVARRTVQDEFIIIATDGLWSAVSDEIACKTVQKCLSSRRAREAAVTLAQVAIGKGSRGNVTVIVVQLQ